jgi:hypothetical protein
VRRGDVRRRRVVRYERGDGHLPVRPFRRSLRRRHPVLQLPGGVRPRALQRALRGEVPLSASARPAANVCRPATPEPCFVGAAPPEGQRFRAGT